MRTLAGAALVVTGAYGAFIAVLGVALTVDCSVAPEHCDDEAWLPPVIAVATLIAALASYRALPALWRAARRAERQGAPFRRFGVAWLAALPWGLLSFWPAAAQILYTVLAVPAVLGYLLLSRAAMGLLGKLRVRETEGR